MFEGLFLVCLVILIALKHEEEKTTGPSLFSRSKQSFCRATNRCRHYQLFNAQRCISNLGFGLPPGKSPTIAKEGPNDQLPFLFLSIVFV